jgi:hypothetical protein
MCLEALTYSKRSQAFASLIHAAEVQREGPMIKIKKFHVVRERLRALDVE